jgi:hypothetical protein
MKTGIIALAALAALAAAALPAAAQHRGGGYQDAFNDCCNQLSGTNSRARVDAVRRLGDVTSGVNDERTVRVLIAMLRSEIVRGGGGKSEEMVDLRLLSACTEALRKVDEPLALALMIEQTKKTSSGRESRLAYYLSAGFNLSASGELREKILALLDHRDLMVQMGIVDALVAEGDSASLDLYFKVLGGKKRRWEVKKCALAGIEKHLDPDDKEMIYRLVRAARELPEDQMRVKSDIRDLLRRVTGKKNEELKKDAGPSKGRTVAEFFGIPTESSRIIFILDRTGSMKDRCTWRPEEKENKSAGAPAAKKKEGEETPNWKEGADALFEEYRDFEIETKMDALKREYIKTIYKLPDYVHFTTVWYDTKAELWEKKLVPATWENKLSAMLFADEIVPNGGTNIWDAIEVAFKVGTDAKLKPNGNGKKKDTKKSSKKKKPSGKPSGYDEVRKKVRDRMRDRERDERRRPRGRDEPPEDPEKAAERAREAEKELKKWSAKKSVATKGHTVPGRDCADTFYLLTDGKPNQGRIRDQRTILGVLKDLNVLRKVTIHTICLGDPGVGRDPPDPKFLKKLAEEHGGSFRHLSDRARTK